MAASLAPVVKEDGICGLVIDGVKKKYDRRVVRWYIHESTVVVVTTDASIFTDLATGTEKYYTGACIGPLSHSPEESDKIIINQRHGQRGCEMYICTFEGRPSECYILEDAWPSSVMASKSHFVAKVDYVGRGLYDLNVYVRGDISSYVFRSSTQTSLCSWFKVPDEDVKASLKPDLKLRLSDADGFSSMAFIGDSGLRYTEKDGTFKDVTLPTVPRIKRERKPLPPPPPRPSVREKRQKYQKKIDEHEAVISTLKQALSRLEDRNSSASDSDSEYSASS